MFADERNILRKARSVTRIPVSIDASGNDFSTLPSSTNATAAMSSGTGSRQSLVIVDSTTSTTTSTTSDACSRSTISSGDRSGSGGSVHDGVTGSSSEFLLEQSMDSAMETILRQWDAETTTVAISDVPPTSIISGRKISTSKTPQSELSVDSAVRSTSRPRQRTRPETGRWDYGGGVPAGSERMSAAISSSLPADSQQYFHSTATADYCNNNKKKNCNNSGRGGHRLLAGDDNSTAWRSLSETRCPTGNKFSSSMRQLPGSGVAFDVGHAGGQRQPQRQQGSLFHVEFDSEGYQPDDVTVSIVGSRLTVHGVRRESDDATSADHDDFAAPTSGLRGAGGVGGMRRTTTEFCRRIRIPDDVDRTGLTCVMADGRVIIEAPRFNQPEPAAVHRSVRNGTVLDPDILASRRASVSAADQPLNTVVVSRVQRPSHDQDEGGTVQQMTLIVDVGRLFRPDDITVKVKNSTSTLTIVAERVDTAQQDGQQSDTEVSGPSRGTWRRLDAKITLEFDVPGAVEVNSLKAGLTGDGLLRISANMK